MGFRGKTIIIIFSIVALTGYLYRSIWLDDELRTNKILPLRSENLATVGKVLVTSPVKVSEPHEKFPALSSTPLADAKPLNTHENGVLKGIEEESGEPGQWIGEPQGDFLYEWLTDIEVSNDAQETGNALVRLNLDLLSFIGGTSEPEKAMIYTNDGGSELAKFVYGENGERIPVLVMRETDKEQVAYVQNIKGEVVPVMRIQELTMEQAALFLNSSGKSQEALFAGANSATVHEYIPEKPQTTTTTNSSSNQSDQANLPDGCNSGVSFKALLISASLIYVLTKQQ
jgi:hypothetical protein